MRQSSRLFSSQLSAVHRGVAFEERSLKILQDHLSMSLHRVGGKSDGGIDLLGWWWLPLATTFSSDRRKRLRILCQCKAEKKKMGPNYVREMEGVLHRYISVSNPTPGQTPTTTPDAPSSPAHPVALLISESPFTKATLLRAQSSPIPFFLLHIPPGPPNEHDDQRARDGAYPIGTAFWNPALAGVRGLLGDQLEMRWERSADDQGRPGLWWCGRRLKSWTPDSDASAVGNRLLGAPDTVQ